MSKHLRPPIHRLPGSASGWSSAAVAALALVLGGCSQDMSDLRNYAEKVKQRKAGPVEPIPELAPYEEFTYQAGDLDDPFARRLAGGGQQEGGNAGIRPDADRAKEPLEEFPLDALSMSGILESKDHRWALIRSPQGTIHRVQVGDHMGMNYGRITQITPTRIDLVEIVPDGLGGWMERDASIAVKQTSE